MILFHAFGRPVPLYGVFLAAALALGISGLLWFGVRRGIQVGALVDLIYITIFAGLLGSRLTHVAFHWADFAGRPVSEMFALWRGGMSYFGGLLFAVPAYFLYLRWRQLPVWEVSDLLAFLVAFAQGLLRLGCFTAGCCGGVACELPWAMDGRHPTQLYEAAVLFILAGFLFQAWRRRWFVPGDLACIFFAVASLARFLIEFLRADHVPLWGRSSFSQLASLFLFAGAIALFRVKREFWR